MISFTFNNERRDYIAVLQGRKRPPWSPIKRSILAVPGVPGGFLQSTDIDVRTIEVPVFIKGENLTHLQRLKEDLAAWLVTDRPAPLVFDDDPDRTYYAVVDDTVGFDEIIKFGSGTIKFICPDPYVYGKEQTTNATVTTSGQSVNVSNTGSAKTYPVITATFFASAQEFKVSKENQFVRVIWNFVAGDVLIVDFSKRKVLINGNLAMTSIDLMSDFFALEKGDNVLQFTPSGYSVEITFQERWL
jgi:predicted phage tail component-like protein